MNNSNFTQDKIVRGGKKYIIIYFLPNILKRRTCDICGYKFCIRMYKYSKTYWHINKDNKICKLVAPVLILYCPECDIQVKKELIDSGEGFSAGLREFMYTKFREQGGDDLLKYYFKFGIPVKTLNRIYKKFLEVC